MPHVYRISLDTRNLTSPTLGQEIFQATKAFRFDLSEGRRDRIVISCCPQAINELLSLDFPALRRDLLTERQIHPDVELVFVGYDRQPVAVQRGFGAPTCAQRMVVGP